MHEHRPHRWVQLLVPQESGHHCHNHGLCQMDTFLADKGYIGPRVFVCFCCCFCCFFSFFQFLLLLFVLFVVVVVVVVLLSKGTSTLQLQPDLARVLKPELCGFPRRPCFTLSLKRECAVLTAVDMTCPPRRTAVSPFQGPTALLPRSAWSLWRRSETSSAAWSLETAVSPELPGPVCAREEYACSVCQWPLFNSAAGTILTPH